MVESKPAAPSASKSEPESKSDLGKGLADALKAQHTARTVVPGRDGVDARLDNRSPEELEVPPKPGPDDSKPQSIDGPDVAGQVEHTREVLSKRKKG